MQTLLTFLAYGFLIGIYALFVWFGRAPVDGFLPVITGALAMLGAHHIRQSALPTVTGIAASDILGLASAPEPAPTTASAPTKVTQSGFARLSMTFLLAGLSIGCMLLLSGCASWLQAASAYEQSGLVSARAAEDLNIDAWRANACGTPLSAIVRHPEVAGGLKSLCMGATAGTAADLLSQIGSSASVPATSPAASFVIPATSTGK